MERRIGKIRPIPAPEGILPIESMRRIWGGKSEDLRLLEVEMKIENRKLI